MQVKEEFIDGAASAASISSIGTRGANVASFILISKILAFALAGATLIVVARILGPSIYGVYTVALAVVGVFGSVSDFGIASAVKKFLPEYSAKGLHKEMGILLSNGIAIMLAIGISLSVVAYFLSGAISAYAFQSIAYAYVIRYVSLCVILSMLYGLSYSTLISMHQGRQVAAAVLVQSSTQSILSIVLALSGFAALAPILGLIAGMFLGSVYAFWRVFSIGKFHLPLPSIREARKILSFSFPIAVSNVLGAVVNNLSLIILGAFASQFVIGNFGITSKTSSLLGVAVEAISVALLPMFSTTLSGEHTRAGISKLYDLSIRLSLVIMMPAVLYIVLLSRSFTFTVFGGSYTLAPLYVAIMAVGMLLGIIGTYSMALFISAGKVRSVLKYNAVVAAVQLASLALLVPRFGGLGAVLLVFIVTPITSSLLFGIGARKSLNVHLNYDIVFHIIVAGMISAIFILPLRAVMGNIGSIAVLFICALLQVAVYPPIVARLHGISRKELEIVKSSTKKIPLLGTIAALISNYALKFAK